MSQWYVVHTQPRGEETARRHLERQGFTTYLPRYRKQRRHARRTDWVNAPLFPNYLFLEMDPENRPWRSINGTMGVNWLVCQGHKPSPLPDGVVEAIRKRENDDGLVSLDNPLPFKPGEEVQVLDGPFQDQTGLFAGLDDKERIVVLLGLLGREARVAFPQELVAATS